MCVCARLNDLNSFAVRFDGNFVHEIYAFWSEMVKKNFESRSFAWWEENVSKNAMKLMETREKWAVCNESPFRSQIKPKE